MKNLINKIKKMSHEAKKSDWVQLTLWLLAFIFLIIFIPIVAFIDGQSDLKAAFALIFLIILVAALLTTVFLKAAKLKQTKQKNKRLK